MITVRLRSSDSSGIRIRLCSIGYAWTVRIDTLVTISFFQVKHIIL